MRNQAADISDLLGSDLEDIDDSEWSMESEESEESTSDEDEDGEEIMRAAVDAASSQSGECHRTYWPRAMCPRVCVAGHGVATVTHGA